MTLIDTSALIEYVRATGSPVHLAVRTLIAEGNPIAVAAPVMMEFLAGARDDAHAERLRTMLESFDCRPVEGLRDFESAARIYRTCRRAGVTIRSLLDCLIAAVALREGLPLLAHDRDFERIAEVTGLKLVAA